MRLSLTDDQRQLYTLIEREIRAGRKVPSYREMQRRMGLRSQSGIFRLVVALEERGWIVRAPHKARTIALAPEAAGYRVHLPEAVDQLLHRHIAEWPSAPEAVIIAAVAEYLGRRV